MNASGPLVSVVIPAYNAETFIERTLYSVLQQTYQNIEVLVINDGSSDSTTNIVERIAKADSRLHLYHQKNAGVAAARNLGIQQSKGKLIAFIDADDLWHRENLQKQVDCFLKSDASVGLVYSWSYNIDADDQPIWGFSAARIQGVVYKVLLCHNFIGNASATMIRRECFDEVGVYDCSLKNSKAQGCEDFDLNLRIAERYQFRVVPQFLVGYRKLAHSMSSDYQDMAKFYNLVLDRFRSRHPEIPAVLYSLARNSFYIYLCKQNLRSKNYKKSLYWLGQAYKANLFTSLVRPDFYKLLLQSLLSLLFQKIQTSQSFSRLLKLFQGPSANKAETEQMLVSKVFPRRSIAIPTERDLPVLSKVLAVQVVSWFSSSPSDISKNGYL